MKIGRLPEHAPALILQFGCVLVSGQTDSEDLQATNRQNLIRMPEKAGDYEKRLPNFVCTEIAHRAADSSGTGSRWKEIDNYEVQVTYFDGHDHLLLVKLNGKATKKTNEQIGGLRSEGLYGSLASWIFSVDARTDFRLARIETFEGRQAFVYEYHVPREHSGWRATERDAQGRYRNGSVVKEGFHGTIFADPESSSLFRINAVLDSDSTTEAFIEYGDVAIAGQAVRLPIKAQVRSSDGKQLLRNTF